MDIPLSTYSFKNVGYNLESILLFYQSNRIDTDLDCHRGYVWTSEQKQQLIDTLIKTVEHLSSRKIGGIITIEKENTLNYTYHFNAANNHNVKRIF